LKSHGMLRWKEAYKADREPRHSDGFLRVQHPIVASAAGVMFLVGRIVYFLGYATGSPSKRLGGGPLYGLALLILLGICGKSVVGLAMSKLSS
jgi:hypothetical protein